MKLHSYTSPLPPGLLLLLLLQHVAKYCELRKRPLTPWVPFLPFDHFRHEGLALLMMSLILVLLSFWDRKHA